ncbi:bifunctional folylpolyglutamate synthase/dihydrofolate synthase [Spiroplasma turonicum]|uniref:tetrahydrofolate synthase n=1 Tax=Spiroplasma turonicum TaxID=216946 RepID=A0A0K1P4U9_9MOLU|nr:Mur ligase family protein [Spiroplasma turonicum]AKU79308.1 folylpolyglutamate synthase [Spiroplasma turonicum]ALX70331.1 folylpolyglutamate synthase [Spiroplasma turonicum]
MIKVDDIFIKTNSLFSKKYNLKKLLSDIGNPQDNLKVINVVGTNGKGSTSKFIYDGLLTKYKNVGLFTSPAFLYQNERIQLNNNLIGDDELKSIYDYYEKNYLQYELTFFEIWTFIAILFFSKYKMDYVVVEAGIGGLLDCTNLFNNQVAVCLTSVSMDHEELLGNSIESIINHKIKITKKNSPVFISEDNFIYKNFIDNYKDIKLIYTNKIKTEVDYQSANAGLAKELLKYLNVDFTNFIAPVGRFTILNENPLFLIDGCHNIDGVKKFVQEIKKYGDFIFLYASSKEKDHNQIINYLKENVSNLYITEFDHIKSWKISNEIKARFNYVNNWKIFLNKNIYNNIVVCGSLYFIPQVFEWYRSELDE